MSEGMEIPQSAISSVQPTIEPSPIPSELPLANVPNANVESMAKPETPNIKTDPKPGLFRMVRSSLQNFVSNFIRPQESQVQESPDSSLHQQMSRRTFLKKVGLGTAAATLSAPVILNEIKDQLVAGFRKGLTDTAVSNLLRVSELDNRSENPLFRPLQEIISEGITEYEKKSNIKVFYRRSKGYKDINYYADSIKKIIENSMLPRPATIPDEVIKSFPAEAAEAFESSNMRFSLYLNIFNKGSGFLSRLEKDHPDLFDKQGYIRSVKALDVTDKQGRIEVSQAKQYVEQLSQMAGHSVSSSHVLEFFLGKNEGDLSKSLYDTALFLKVMARSDPITGRSKADAENSSWYQGIISDEFQGPTYNNNKLDDETLNLIGKPYHAWNIAMLLQFFPPELIQAGALHRQIATFSEQGLGKTRADLQTLSDLRATETTLLQYSTNT